jgi:hypothetical protein
MISQAPSTALQMLVNKLLRRPLLRPKVVMFLLGISHTKLISMIEAGELTWAWDIGFGKTRREVRVLNHSVVEKKMGTIANIGRMRNLKLPEVLNLFLPQTRSSIRGGELQRLLDCNSDSIRRYYLSGELKKISKALPKFGPNSSPHFTRESIVGFFTKRRIL